MCDVSGREWELKVQEYEDEDEDEDEEPSVWTRVRSLLLSLSLQLHHRLKKIREQLQRASRMLGDAANAVRRLLAPPLPHHHPHSQQACLQYRVEPLEARLWKCCHTVAGL